MIYQIGDIRGYILDAIFKFESIMAKNITNGKI